MPDFPHIFFYEEDDESGAAGELARILDELRITAPLLLSSVHGRRVSAEITSVVEVNRPQRDANQDWAADLGAKAQDAGADAIVAVGGGRILDVGKLAASRAGLQLVVVPTQLSHDGICSPVAVVPDAEGRAESVGASEPQAVFLSLPTLFGAPAQSVAAGIGDLLANPLALRDWKLASERGIEELDDRAWDLSIQSFEMINDHLDDDPVSWSKDTDALKSLADALVLSGMAMIAAGTSRPASGGEHEVSHAIDEEFGGRAMHGAQVAFGCVITTALYDDDVNALRTVLERMGLPHHPKQLGLDTEELVRVLLAAPNTRPGRFTIIEHENLDESDVRKLIAKIWP